MHALDIAFTSIVQALNVYRAKDKRFSSQCRVKDHINIGVQQLQSSHTLQVPPHWWYWWGLQVLRNQCTTRPEICTRRAVVSIPSQSSTCSRYFTSPAWIITRGRPSTYALALSSPPPRITHSPSTPYPPFQIPPCTPSTWSLIGVCFWRLKNTVHSPPSVSVSHHTSTDLPHVHLLWRKMRECVTVLCVWVLLPHLTFLESWRVIPASHILSCQSRLWNHSYCHLLSHLHSFTNHHGKCEYVYYEYKIFTTGSRKSTRKKK